MTADGIQKRTACGQRRSDGFSLIEVAIALIIIGLLMTPVIESYNQQAVHNKLDVTNENFVLVNAAIQDYFAHYNSLPCPADQTLSRSNANYGAPNCIATIAAGSTPPVMVGSVPFKALNIAEAASLDAWNDRIAYTVVKADTVAPVNVNPPNVNLIEIKCNDDKGVACVPVEPDPLPPIPPPVEHFAHYILVSYGDDGLGGYTVDGVTKGACPPSSVRESMNCDRDAVFYEAANARSMTPGGTAYLDDLTSYVSTLSPGIWTYVPPGSASTVTAYDNIWTQDYIGIGTTDPQALLDVNGNIKMENDGAAPGLATSDRVCDPNGVNCFPTKIIGGTGMGSGPSPQSTTGCDPVSTTAMTAVKNGDAVCAVQTGLSVKCPACGKTMTCPNGQYVQSIDAGGNVTCATPPAK